MAYRRITWLPDVLRAEGIEVVLYHGWEKRGLSTSRPFDVQNVVWHHDASAPGDSPGVPEYMIRNFNNAGAQVWVDRKGRWHIIASGRAPHAGAARRGMPTNYNSLGIETDHTTGEDWPQPLLDSLRRGTAAILRRIGKDADEALHFHKTICDPPGRKIDPAGLDLAPERRRVNYLISNEEDALTPAQMKELKEHITTEARRAEYSAKIPVPAGSLAAEKYGDNHELTLPNAVYWLFREVMRRRKG